MGTIIDLKYLDTISKCKEVKFTVIIINLVGAPLSFLLLVICIIRMILIKRILTFLTRIIILIFFSEIFNTISKMFQLLKYNFKDTRYSGNSNDVETPRGIICQIQIVMSIISDFGSLLGTLLITIRCYDVIRNRRKFFDKKKVQMWSFIIIILSSIILSVIFLLIDKLLSSESTFIYDIRDRCNYWCWLDDFTSMACYSLYMVLVVINLIYACKTNCFLEREYEKLLDQNMVLIPSSNSNNLEEKKENEKEKESRKKSSVSSDITIRIKELRLMKMKVLIYPWITNIIWILLLIYRLLDVIVMESIKHNNEVEKEKEEKQFFEDNVEIRVLYEIFLVLHTLLSSIRGIIYSLTFIIFEEKVFWNCFKRFINCCNCCCFKSNDLEDLEEEDDEEYIRNTCSTLTERNTLITELMKRDTNETNLNGRKSNISDIGKNYSNMNTSDYHY